MGTVALRPLPAPMLARPGPLPTRGEWAFEVKWDGFRCLVSTEDGFRARSRRGWSMSEHLLELADLPVRGVFDGEVVAFGDDGRPDFSLVCRRLLHGDDRVPVTYLIFDLLALRGRSLLAEPYRQRRARLARCDFAGVAFAPEAFDDGAALWEAVREQRLEGIVAKRLDEPYRPGERRWVKRKNAGWARYEQERESAIESSLRRRGRFSASPSDTGYDDPRKRG